MKRLGLLLFLGICAFAGGLAAVILVPRLELPAAALAEGTGAPMPVPTSDVVKLGDRFEAVAQRTSPAVVYIEAVKPPAGTGKAKPVENVAQGERRGGTGDHRVLRRSCKLPISLH